MKLKIAMGDLVSQFFPKFLFCSPKQISLTSAFDSDFFLAVKKAVYSNLFAFVIFSFVFRYFSIFI